MSTSMYRPVVAHFLNPAAVQASLPQTAQDKSHDLKFPAALILRHLVQPPVVVREPKRLTLLLETSSSATMKSGTF